MQQTTRHQKTVLLLGALVSLFLSTAVYFYLKQFADPPGVDGYFYLKQIVSLGQRHFFYFKDHSLAFLPAALTDAVTHDERFAFRLTVAGSLGVLFFVFWNLLSEFTAEAPLKVRASGYAILAAALAMNFSLMDLSFGYLKTAIALIFVVWTLQLAARASRTGRAATWASAAATALTALLCHKSSALLLALIALAVVIEKRRQRRVWLAAGGVFVAIAAVFALFFSQGTEYLHHLGASFEFSPKAHWNWALELKREGNFIYFSGLMGLIFLVTYGLQRRRLGVQARVVGDFLVLLLLLSWAPLNSPGLEQPAYRLMLISSILTLPLALVLFVKENSLRLPVGLMLGLLMSQYMSSRSFSSLIPSYSPLDGQVAQIKDFVKPEDHLICHHGLEFYIDYITGIRCQIFVSEDPNQKQWRLVYAPARPDTMRLRLHAKEAARMTLGPDYLLVAENDWDKIRSELSLKTNWRNPDQKRPSFIYAP